jgi:tetratricopeptide (TPR) repeat protein
VKKLILAVVLLVLVVGVGLLMRSTPRRGGESQPAAAEEAWFEDRTLAAGVEQSHVNRTFDNEYAEIMQGYTALGASASVADFDGDGWEDVFFTRSNRDGRNVLYRNNGDFTFTDVAAEAGVAVGNDDENAAADSLWLDYDNDGDPDLLVVRFGQNLLYENRGADGSGDVRFTDVTVAAGLGPRYLNSILAIAFDYDLDGDLDLFLGNYFAPVDLFDPETPRFFPESFETAANGGGMTVYRNDFADSGEKRFTDVTAELGLAELSGWTLDLGHADADHDGDDDLYVAADFGTDNFFRNNGDGTFTDVSLDSIGVDTKKGMNADWGDFDNDGLLDCYVTNITDEYMKEGNFLWQNLGDLQFTDVARETGTHSTGWGWAGKFFDYDNDGWLDLYVVNGWVSGSKDPADNYVRDIFEIIKDPDIDLADARVWPPMGDKTLSGYQRNSLFHNQGGIFSDAAPLHGLDSELDARGVAVADFDHDGRPDLFVTNAGKPPILWRNRQPTGHHWIALRLEGRASNRDAVGARVWVEAGGRPQVGFVNGGNGFASQSSRWLHFGLGRAPRVDRLVVVWPSGLRQEFDDVAADRTWGLVEGDNALQVLAPVGGRLTAGAESLPEGRRANEQVSAPADLLARFGSPSIYERGEEGVGALTPAESGGPAFSTYRAGMDAFAAGDGARALDLLERALGEEPDSLRYGTDYRQVVIALGSEDEAVYDRCLEFFQGLTADHPDAANAWLNLGFAYVDAIPVEGAITQVLLANTALKQFGKAIEIEDGWLARYSRGNALLFWPPLFGRVPAAIADLERALEIAENEPEMPYHARAWAALGDGHWRRGEPAAARQIWERGLQMFPGDPELARRAELTDPDELDTFLEDRFDTTKRVASHLREIFYPDRYAVDVAASRRTEAVEEAPAGGPRFEEVGQAAGARFVHSTRKFSGHKHQVLEMFTDGGAGVAVGDYDGDGDDDLFVTDSDVGRPNRLLRNDTPPGGPLAFTEVAARAGVAGGNDADSIVADALWLDYDNDGRLDLYVGRFGTPLLYRNLGREGGEQRFEEVGAEVGLDRFGNTIGTVAFDADGDGYLDLMLANYFAPLNLNRLDTTHVLPNNLDYADNGGGLTFYRSVALPDGRRGFREATAEAGLDHHTGWSLDIGHADLDNDGVQDVYVAGDYGTDRLFRGNGDGTFVDVTEEALGGYDTEKGMNVDVGDYNRDGWLDIYVTNITDEYMKECNFFWHNLGNGTFMDLSSENGTCDTDWGWAAKFGDFDNDGFEDLFVVNGLRSRDPDKNYIPVLLDTTILKPDVVFSDLDSYPDIEDMSWSGYQKQRLFHNLGDQTFKEMAGAAGVGNDLDGRGIGVGDFDDDGLLDLFQTNANQPSGSRRSRATGWSCGWWAGGRIAAPSAPAPRWRSAARG